MDNQVTIALDAVTGNLLIALGPMKIALAPRDALGLMAGLASMLAQHPQVQQRPDPQVLVASCLPRIAGGIDFNGS